MLSHLARRIIRVPFRAFSKGDDLKREAKARIEIDNHDNPFVDFENYKRNTGQMLQVEQFPRRKLKEIYMFTLEFIKELPADYAYRIMVEEYTRFRLKVVEDTRDVLEIEKKIGYGPVEDLIQAAKNEIELIKLIKEEKPWEPTPLSEFDRAVLDSIATSPFPEWTRKF